MQHNLYELTQEQARIEELLIEGGGELTPELEEALASNSAALADKVDGYNHIYRRLTSFAAAIKNEKDRLAGLQKTYETAARSLKDHLARAMDAAGIEKLESATCKVTWRRTTAVEISDEDALLLPWRQVIEQLSAPLPEWVEVKASVVKTALRKAIEEGAPVNGAAIVNNKTIQIK